MNFVVLIFIFHDILYYYVKVCIIIAHNYLILKAFRILSKVEKNESINYNALYVCFKYLMLIRFNPNYSTFFHNILQRASCQNILNLQH
jgi:hypothetical protein